MSLISRHPCPHCRADEFHQGLICLRCGVATVLKAVEFIHDGRRSQRGYTPGSEAPDGESQRKARQRKRAAAMRAKYAQLGAGT